MYCGESGAKFRTINMTGNGLAAYRVYFAERGAIVTFLDVVEPNVAFAQRVCRLKNIYNASFCYMED